MGTEHDEHTTIEYESKESEQCQQVILSFQEFHQTNGADSRLPREEEAFYSYVLNRETWKTWIHPSVTLWKRQLENQGKKEPKGIQPDQGGKVSENFPMIGNNKESID